MKSSIVRLFCCIALLTCLTTLIPETSRGQQQRVLVAPTELYRFNISPVDGGFLLTGSWQEGQAWGYFAPFTPMAANRGVSAYIGIYMPPPGYTPDPAIGLVPLHRWRVIEYGWRNYFYYSTYYANLGGNYYYEGIQGYVFPPGTRTFPGVGVELTQLSSHYSVTKGFWNGTGVSPDDDGLFVEEAPHGQNANFAYQGIVCAMPSGVVSDRSPNPTQPRPTIEDVWFYASSSPPPGNSCDSGEQQSCIQNGGVWNQDTCSCSGGGGDLPICCD